MKSYSTYSHHNPSRFTTHPDRLSAGILSVDDRFSRMAEALAPRARANPFHASVKSKPVTLRKFSWENA